MRLFHPIDFMLASPVESAEEAYSYFQHAAVEDKYDGIRAQAHLGSGEARLFSRTRDEITESFPELPPALSGLHTDAILDGEIVAWNDSGSGRALPFSTLQQRLGRKNVSANLLRDVPVAYVVFDVLYADGELLLYRPLRERAKILDGIMSGRRTASTAAIHAGIAAPEHNRSAVSRSPQSLFAFAAELNPAFLLRAPVAAAANEEDLETLFTAAR